MGTYQTDGEVSRWLLDALRPLVVLRAADWESPIVPLLVAEATKEEPGQQVVLDRLLDLLLVGALRAAFANGAVAVPAWFSASTDPIVEPVATVTAVASAVGYGSPFTFSTAFKRAHGQSPRRPYRNVQLAAVTAALATS